MPCAPHPPYPLQVSRQLVVVPSLLCYAPYSLRLVCAVARLFMPRFSHRRSSNDPRPIPPLPVALRARHPGGLLFVGSSQRRRLYDGEVRQADGEALGGEISGKAIPLAQAEARGSRLMERLVTLRLTVFNSYRRVFL